jgi:hypothetical protein
MTSTMTHYRSSQRAGRDGFAQLLHEEWTKFRTVRGWVIGMVVAALVTVLLGLLGLLTASGSVCSEGPFPGQPVTQACTGLTGPGGEAVSDSFYFVHKPLPGNGSITVRVTSLTGQYATHLAQPGQAPAAGMEPGVQSWAKAGIIVKESTRPGSAYGAVMATGSHGVRMQYDYAGDTAGLPGAVSPASPRWLRLTRSVATLTGHDSADGTHWTQVGRASLAGLPSTVQAGLFAASPAHTQVIQSLGGSSGTGGPSQATGVFDHVSLRGGWPSGGWSGGQVGNGAGPSPASSPGGFHQAGGGFTMRGSGDIAPAVAGGAAAGGQIEQSLVGAFAGLIAVVVVAAMFITAEGRRGLIRAALAATPRRPAVLAAKAAVLACLVLAAATAAVLGSLLAGRLLLPGNGFTPAPPVHDRG